MIPLTNYRDFSRHAMIGLDHLILFDPEWTHLTFLGPVIFNPTRPVTAYTGLRWHFYDLTWPNLTFHDHNWLLMTQSYPSWLYLPDVSWLHLSWPFTPTPPPPDIAVIKYKTVSLINLLSLLIPPFSKSHSQTGELRAFMRRKVMFAKQFTRLKVQRTIFVALL